jgi:class 3 adenylate cyclase/tetratricopeptide (TPR) repeat protein
MSIFSAYIPMDRRLALAAGRPLPDRVRGAALFADISGFTALSEKLEHVLGAQRGAEEMTRQLNTIYGALILEVHRYGGSVISFSGDAITCWFDADEGLLATTCAQQMQAILSQYGTFSAAGGKMELVIKIAVVSGAARRFVVGLEQVRLIDALAGRLLDRMAAAGNLAKQGEILLGKEVATALAGRASIGEWRTAATQEQFALLARLTAGAPPAPWPTPPSIPDEITRPWLLPQVYEQLRRGQGHYIAELRPAVSLFLKFSGLDYDGEDDAGEKLSAFIGWVQMEAYRYEGTVLQLTIGDKGSYLHAVFGAPVAHEDDARRAVTVASTLRTGSERFPFLDAIHIGIARGQMRVGAYGSQTRRTYGALGSAVNLAARLMEQAMPTQVLVTESFAAASGEAYEFEPLPPVRLKGLAEEVRPLAVRERRRPLAGTRPPVEHGDMVGREEEKAQLLETLQRLVYKQGSGCVLVEGEAGIGKTRLLADFVQAAQRLGVRCLLGNGDAIEASTPYHAWRPVLRELFAEASEASLVEAVQARLGAIDRGYLRLLPLLNSVLPLDLPDNELTAQLSGEARSDNLHEMLLRLLEEEALAAPVTLLMEDAVWLDSASWALVQLVQRELSPLLLVLASRPFSEQTPAAYAQLRGAPDTQLIALQTLPAVAIEAMLRQRLGVSTLHETFSHLIQEKAEGNPFFSEELAFALRDAGLAEISDDTARLTAATDDLAQLGFPDTIQGVIISRLDRLQPSQQLALKVASIIGRVFAYLLLCEIHPVEEERPRLRRRLRQLDKMDITSLVAVEPSLVYSFKHIITQEVAYGMMTFEQRQQLHQATAERLELEEEQVNYALLAHHWLRAVGAEPTDAPLAEYAIGALDKAGEQAIRDNANQEAAGFLHEAVTLDERVNELAPAHPRHMQEATALHQRRARWHRELSAAKNAMGDQLEATAHLEEAARLLGVPFPESRWQWTTRSLSEISRQALRRLLGWGIKRHEPKDREEKLLEVARTYGARGTLYAVTNDFPRALYMLLAGFNQAELAGPSRELALAYADMGNVAGAIPLHRLALQYVDMAEETARTLDEDRTTAVVSARICVHLVTIGQWERAETSLQRALKLSEAVKDRRLWEEAANILNAFYFYRGELRACVKLGKEINASARYRDDTLFELWSTVSQAGGYLRLGEFSAALEMATLALAIFSRSELSDPGNRIQAHAVLSVAHAEMGELEMAQRHARQALEWLQRHPDPVTGRVTAAALTAEAHLTLLSRAGSQLPATFHQDVAKACQMLSRRHRAYPLLKVPAHLFQGLYSYLQGKPAKARRQWQECTALVERFPMRYEAGLAHYYLAREAGESGHLEDQRLHAAKSAALFDEIGAVHLRRQVETLGAGR